MKIFLKEYWPFIPLFLIISIVFAIITIAIIGDMYSYQAISIHNLRSDNNYDNSIDRLNN